MHRWLGFIVASVAGLLLAVLATTPPAPVPASAGPERFSAGRAMVDVQRIAAKPHPTGSAENAEVRAYLVSRLQGLGLEVREARAPMPERSAQRLAKWSKGTLVPTELVNIIGVLPGKDRALPAVMLMAHHDTVWGSPGAADDTAGVASILEALRAITVQGQTQRDIVVLLSDAEETGLTGAKAFYADDPARLRVGAVVNMEARGGGGRTTLFQTSRNNGNAMRLFADVAERPGASSLAAYIYSVLPNDTDLSVTLKAGDTVSYNFAFIGRPGLYHSPKSTPERLDQGALQDMGSQVLAITHALATAQKLPEPAPDVVFFDVFGQFMVTYPAWGGWLMIAGIVAGLGMAAKGGWAPREALRGAGRMLGLLIGTGLALFVLNRISGAGTGSNYYDRLAAIPLLEGMAALTCMAAYLLAFGKSERSQARMVGGTGLLALLGLGAQIAAPTAAYVILWPVLLATAALLAVGRGSGRAKWLAVACAALAMGYLVYMGHFIMQGVGPVMPSVVALPLALVAAALLPIWPGLAARANRNTVLALAGLALCTALWIRLDPMADTIAVYSSDKTTPPIPITKDH